MTAPELDALLGRIRHLTQRYLGGGPEAFEPFRELLDLLLRVTVLHHQGTVRLTRRHGEAARGVLSGWRGPGDPLPLRDGRYLRLDMELYVAPPEEQNRLKVYEASYQYQVDLDGDRWIFRYDYRRSPPDPYPAAHFQVRGTPVEADCLPADVPLERIHFPTDRVSLEAVIRLLADQFKVPCAESGNIWRQVLQESEAVFAEIAHRPRPGPDDIIAGTH